VLEGSARRAVAPKELEDQAFYTAGALTKVQELEKKCKADAVAPKEKQADAKSREKIVEDISGAYSKLCAALANLRHLQEKHAVDETIVKLTRRWEDKTRRNHSAIRNRLRQQTGTEGLQHAIPETRDWIGPWHLGAGSFGRASMYAKLSDTGDIIDRVVVKDCDHDQNADVRETWDEGPSFFSLNDDEEEVPTEVLTMFDLKGKQGSEYIVKILNWRIASERRLYRLYLEVSSSVWRLMTQTTNGLAVRKPSQDNPGKAIICH
jgi:hypothetical protein